MINLNLGLFVLKHLLSLSLYECVCAFFNAKLVLLGKVVVVWLQTLLSNHFNLVCWTTIENLFKIQRKVNKASVCLNKEIELPYWIPSHTPNHPHTCKQVSHNWYLSKIRLQSDLCYTTDLTRAKIFDNEKDIEVTIKRLKNSLKLFLKFKIFSFPFHTHFVQLFSVK